MDSLSDSGSVLDGLGKYGTVLWSHLASEQQWLRIMDVVVFRAIHRARLTDSDSAEKQG